VQRFRAIDNGTFGVVIKADVSADLTDAELLRNNWSGLRVEGDTLPGATARITLMGATVEGNGVDRQVDANDAERERCGVVLERNAATASLRLGFRLRSTDIWTYHVWIPEASMYGGGGHFSASGFIVKSLNQLK
jgi:hypothetical protein